MKKGLVLVLVAAGIAALFTIPAAAKAPGLNGKIVISRAELGYRRRAGLHRRS